MTVSQAGQLKQQIFVVLECKLKVQNQDVFSEV